MLFTTFLHLTFVPTRVKLPVDVWKTSNSEDLFAKIIWTNITLDICEMQKFSFESETGLVSGVGCKLAVRVVS